MRKLKIEFPSAKQTNVPKTFYVHLPCTNHVHGISFVRNNPFSSFGAAHRKSNGEHKLSSFPGFILFCSNEATTENGGLRNAVYFSGLGLAG